MAKLNARQKSEAMYNKILNGLNARKDVEVFVQFGNTIRTRLISEDVCRYTDDFDPKSSWAAVELYRSCFYDDGMTTLDLVKAMKRYDQKRLGAKILHVNVLSR